MAGAIGRGVLALIGVGLALTAGVVLGGAAGATLAATVLCLFVLPAERRLRR